MDITPPSLNALRTHYNQIFQQSFLKTEVLWPKIATLIASKGETETHVFLDRIPQLRKWVGDRVLRSASLRSYILPNVPYELTEALDVFRVEDNKIAAFDPVVQMMSERAKKWPDALLFTATTGTLPSGTSVVTWDGVSFYNTAHPVNFDLGAAAGTQSNLSSSGKALSSANYGSVRQLMRGYKGADFLPLLVDPDMLVVPPALEPTGIQILKDEWIAPAAAVYNNAANTLQQNVFYGSADLMCVPDLAGQDTTWYLNDCSNAIKPFIFQLRTPAKFVMRTRPDDEPIFAKHEIQYGVDVRGNTGYGPYFYSYSATA